MRSRIIVCAVLLVALLLPMLSACGFGGSDALEIENISAQILDDGTTRITIKYYDDMEDPVIFDIPRGMVGETGAQGEQGDRGATGNGIKEIKLSNVENGEQVMSIYYTDPGHPVTEVKVKDGVRILKAERVDEEGTAYLYMQYSDGSDAKIELPKGDTGDAGVSVIGVVYDIEEETNQTLVSFMLSTGAEIGPIRINPGQDGMNLTNEVRQSVVTDPISGEATGVDIQFVLADGSVTGKIHVPYGKNGVGIASLSQAPLRDENGHIIGTRFNFIKTDGTETDVVEVLNGVGVSDMKYKVLPDGKTQVTVVLTDGTMKSFELPAAVSIKEITQTIDAHGNTVLTIHMTDDSVPPITVTLQEANGIDYITSGESENGTEYQLTIYYTNGTNQTVTFAKNSAWHNGSDKDPTPEFGKKGDYYFDQWKLIIWYKVDNRTWSKVVDFHAFEKTVTVTFSLDKSAGEKWAGDGYLTAEWPFTLTVGSSFASANYSLPIPAKDGYRFVGWYATRTPNTAINGAFTDMTVIPNTDAITLFPVWEALS